HGKGTDRVNVGGEIAARNQCIRNLQILAHGRLANSGGGILSLRLWIATAEPSSRRIVLLSKSWLYLFHLASGREPGPAGAQQGAGAGQYRQGGCIDRSDGPVRLVERRQPIDRWL